MSLIPTCWSLWPPSEGGKLNFVSGDRALVAEITSLLLIRRGELPLTPEFGMSPQLFDNISSLESRYWAFNVQSAIVEQIPHIVDCRVLVTPRPEVENALVADIAFRSDFSTNTNGAAIGFYWAQYVNAISDPSQIPTFRSSIFQNVYTGVNGVVNRSSASSSYSMVDPFNVSF